DSVYNATVMPGMYYSRYVDLAQQADYIIITHSSLYSVANSYATYRNSSGYQTLMVDIDQLYDQYAYGIPKHPLSIHNFIRALYAQYQYKIKHFLLIGKGIHSEMCRQNVQYYSQNLIPTYGTPPSDQFYTAGLMGDIPKYSIGRIAASNLMDVNIYLNKVIQYETAPSANWQKRVLHFGGGINSTEQLMIQGYLLSLEQIIEDTLYGGFVQTFLKNSSLPIQITISDSIRHLINDGCGLMNFFGHGTSGGFDQNIDEPSTYQNDGRYPLLFANTCLSGDIHLPDYKRVAERWVIIPNKGSIAFLASADLGNAAYLFLYASEFYRQITYNNFGQPIGKCIQKTAEELILQSGAHPLIKNTVYDYTLHGDPAIRMPVKLLPDLTIHSSDVFFSPNNITNDLDTFELKIIVTNYGKAFVSPYEIRINRTFSNGVQQTYSKISQKCLYKDTVIFRLPVDFINGAGNNEFCITADASNWIQETNETNNQICIQKYVSISDVTPIFPYEFAIFPNDSVTLMASTGNPFIPMASYVFEIDTTDLFNSPFKQTGIVSQPGGIISWRPPIQLTDCTVYYWRVALASNLQWKESSFIYISGKVGWSQAHFFQFKKDLFKYINYNRNNRTLEFVTTPKELRCQTMGASAATSYFDYFYNLDNIVERSSCSPGHAILAVVIDPYTIEPWTSDRNNYGHVNYPVCPPKLRPDYYFTFFSDAQGLANLTSLLKDTVPIGHYILLYNFRLGNFQQWPEALYQTLEMMGALQIRAVPDDGAYIFFCKKGDFNSVIELAGNKFDTLILDIDIPVNFFNGFVHSTLIGPSTHWKTFHWLPKSNEFPTKDYEQVSIVAYKANFDSTVVIPVITRDTLDLYNLDNYVNAQLYPYLRLLFYTQDDSLKSPTQLKRWQITYDGVPETAISPSDGYYFVKDTLQEGDSIRFAVATRNISPYNMDSLLVRYWVQNKDNQLVPIKTKRLRKHPSSDVLIDTVVFSTKGLPGLNYLWYEVNCVNPQFGTYDQLEQYHFNNFAVKAFYVTTDKMNPLLDVTFDGVRIMDNDIVSARPLIVIQLKDENKFLALNDTSLFAIYLTDMNTNIERRIYFNNSESPLLFYPAQLPKNSCKIEYRPILTDGMYMLRVQAKDVSNNISGQYDYTIRFRVITRQAISYVLNYPNPFSTSTRFVFTLTGSQIPDEMRIEIYTITGRLVKTIRNEELGNIHIGRNITEYAWDGTDNFGDKLATGTYFYRVVATYKGKRLEHLETEADTYFKHGFGKLYILR
ncbi:MAG: C25 family cysteine peptidase, partial [Bacteroidales bacterium]|nr:C25 family cysteine peptidase [Bacteroidales bacterium]